VAALGFLHVATTDPGRSSSWRTNSKPRPARKVRLINSFI
jgi:hypothetical protein